MRKDFFEEVREAVRQHKRMKAYCKAKDKRNRRIETINLMKRMQSYCKDVVSDGHTEIERQYWRIKILGCEAVFCAVAADKRDEQSLFGVVVSDDCTYRYRQMSLDRLNSFELIDTNTVISTLARFAKRNHR